MAAATRAEWYVQLSGVEEGPMTSQTLRSLAAAGRISPDTPIRKQGMTKTVPASKVKGLLTHPARTHVSENPKRQDNRLRVSQTPKQHSKPKSGARPSVKEILSEQYWGSNEENVEVSWANSVKELGLTTIGSVLTGSGIFFVPYMARIGQKLAQKIGLKCEKTVDRMLSFSYPLAVLSIAVSLSEAQVRILGVEDTQYGSIIEAELPSDWRSYGGTMFFEVLDDGASRVRVAGTSLIKGQLFDYGKGKKALTEILEGAEHFLGGTSMRRKMV